MSKLVYTLPEPKVKAKAQSDAFIVTDGPFEVTAHSGRKVRWAIITRTFPNGNVAENMLRAEPDGKQPVEMGLSKQDIWRAVFADVTKRNI